MTRNSEMPNSVEGKTRSELLRLFLDEGPVRGERSNLVNYSTNYVLLF